MHLIRRALAAILAASLAAGPLAAEPVPFDGAWKEQGFLRLFSNDYAAEGRRLGVVSDGTVSIFWRPINGAARQAEGAAWQWRVDAGVPPTDLTIKGGDDRNLALYFVFLDPASAKGASGASARRVLKNPNVRALVYVWGGDHDRGAILPSPYHPRLATKILRPAGTGQHGEAVDLVRDFGLAFGEDIGVLVGIGVSADSDDTGTSIRAAIADLSLKLP